MEPSAEARKLANYLADTLDGEPRETELKYYEANGYDKLESLLEKASIDVYDLMRPSAI